MTTPLSKMVARLILSPLTPKRVRGSAGSLSKAKKGVGGCVAIACRPKSPMDLLGVFSVATAVDIGPRRVNLHVHLQDNGR